MNDLLGTGEMASGLKERGESNQHRSKPHKAVQNSD